MIWLFLQVGALLVTFLASVRAFWWVTSGRHKIGRVWTGKNVVITGANSGIGLETCRILLKHGATVYMLCRNKSSAEEAEKELALTSTGKTVFVHCDLSSLNSVRKTAGEILEKVATIDVLINNAGIGGRGTKGAPVITEDDLEETMASNYFGHFLLTHLLLKRLKESTPARIINVSSLMHQFADDNFSADNLNFDDRGTFQKGQGYNYSKLAQILFTRYLAKELRGTGVSINSLHPGLVKTNIFFRRNPTLRMVALFFSSFLKNAEEGAQTTLFLADSDAVNYVSGHHFADCAAKGSSLKSLDDKLAEEVFKRSCQLTGIEKFFG